MLDENLIATLEQSLRQTRNAQNRLMAQLREKEAEVEDLRIEVGALENSAAQTEKAIDSLLVATRSGKRPTNFRIVEDDGEDPLPVMRRVERHPEHQELSDREYRRDSSVAYFNQNRNGGPPPIHTGYEPLSNRFNDRTITQACTLLLRESGSPLHVNELYNLLIAGGMKFKGNNPTISIAVSLNRNRRFKKVDPGTFDLVIREAQQKAS
ncbi:MAG: hypothetical protein IPL32_14710 [Chloracidobacterium sp.]|nr:hypothetical protein [Chloracidobacterium sp.]